MDKFYESNPGLSSRVTNHVNFPDYTPKELLLIGKLMLQDQQYRISDLAEQVVLDYIERRMKQPLFANARSMRNAIDRARMRQANRIFASGNRVLTKADLVTLEAEDFLKSRIFAEPFND
jgi:hypothetical protein